MIIVIVIAGLALLILGHETGHFFAAKAFGLKVDEFGFGFPPRIAAWKKGDTEYSVNWLPFGGFVKIAGEIPEGALMEKPSDETVAPDKLLSTQPAWKKSIIMLAGVFTNFILGWLLISAVLLVGAPQTLVVAGTEPNSPAAAVGFQAGDVIKEFTDSQSFINFVNMHKGQPITIDVIRGNKEMGFTVTPRTDAAPDQGAIGVELSEGGSPSEGFFSALKDGLIDAVLISWLTVQAFYHLIQQLFVHATLLPGVVGPVGIVGVAQETGSIGLIYLVQFLGIISLNLMVVNLIPFPALDGGRFLIVLIEKIKGSAIPAKVEAYVNGLGFALLLILMLLLTVRDVKGLF